jgi:hypothetical protein
MAKTPAKKRGLGMRLPKKLLKYLIIFTGAIMVLSGLYTGLSRDMSAPAAEDLTASWNMTTYDSAYLGDASAVTTIISETNQMILRPNKVGMLSQEDVNDIFEANITGVTSLVFEVAPGSQMFRLEVQDFNVTGEIRKRIRMPGGYQIYHVYRGSTPYGEVSVVGDGLEAQDHVRIILLQRSKGGVEESMGFVQGRLPVGPVVDATVAGVEGVTFSGAGPVGLSKGDITSRLNASDVTLEGSGNISAVSFNMPADADVGAVLGILEGLGVSNVTVMSYGYITAPQEMVVDGRDVKVPNSGALQATFNLGRKVNSTIRARVYILNIGNQSAAFATEALENGTIAR